MLPYTEAHVQIGHTPSALLKGRANHCGIDLLIFRGFDDGGRFSSRANAAAAEATV